MTLDNYPECKLRFEVTITPRRRQEEAWPVGLQIPLVIVVVLIGCGYIGIYLAVTATDLEQWAKFNRAFFADPRTLSPESVARGVRTTKAFLIAFYSVTLFGALRASLQIPQISWIPLIPLAVLTHVVHFFMIRCFTKYLKHLLANKIASNAYRSPTSADPSEPQQDPSSRRVPFHSASTTVPTLNPGLMSVLF